MAKIVEKINLGIMFFGDFYIACMCLGDFVLICGWYMKVAFYVLYAMAGYMCGLDNEK